MEIPNKKREPYTWVPWQKIQENVQVSDQYVRDNYPSDQPYIYTDKGLPVVFRKRVGFDKE